LKKNIVCFLILFLVFLHTNAIGQGVFKLNVLEKQTLENIPFKYKQSFTSPFERERELSKIVNYYHTNGFLAFSVDSIFADSLNSTHYVNIGEKYTWLQLKASHNIEPGILNKAGFNKKDKGNTVSIEALVKLRNNILMQCENQGYPFAEVSLDSIVISDAKVSASLKLTLNNRITYDSIVLSNDDLIKKTFLHHFLSVKKGGLYSEQTFINVDKKLNNLNFIRLVMPSAIVFTDSLCYLNIYIEKKKASNFDGILGIIPDNVSGKIVLTGDIKFKLINNFKSGETLEFNWKRLAESSQRLKAGFAYPYVFNTSLGVDYYIDMHQKDSSFITVNHKPALKYLFDSFDYLGLTAEINNSHLLSTGFFEGLKVLPDYADIKTVLFGMGVHKENLDFRLNPSKGYVFDMHIAAGNRNISKSPQLNPSLYDGIDLKSKQYRFDIETNVFLRIYKQNIIMWAFKGGNLSGNNLFKNELYRLGGVHLLRGFDEESVYASMYGLFTMEYRYLMWPLSYINVFYDACYYENNSINNRVIDRPYGFGAGITFETRQGVFSISYALGKQFNNPVSFKSGKVHLGYVSFF